MLDRGTAKIHLQKFNASIVPFGSVIAGLVLVEDDNELSDQAAQLLADIAALRMALEHRAGER